MGILQGKNILVTGVLTDGSIAFHIAKIAQEEGANVILTGFGRGLSLTTRIAGRLPQMPPIIELDVTNQEHLDGLSAEVLKYLPHLDGVVHSIGFAPESALGGNFLNTEWPDVATAVQISAYSLKSLTLACRPLMKNGGSVVGLDFDAQVARPLYDWMGIAKAALESTSRYLAKYLGGENIRVNLVAAGPISTVAAKSIPGFARFKEINAQAIAGGYEGIMLKDPLALYECKRSVSWLKIKPFIEVSLNVVAVEEGTGKNAGKLGALVCEGTDDGKFIRVNVGSGLTDDQRDSFWQFKDDCIGMVAEIRADAATLNQDSTDVYSLRFPRFLRFRGFAPGEKL